MFRYCLKFDGPLIPGTLIVYVQEMSYLLRKGGGGAR